MLILLLKYLYRTVLSACLLFNGFQIAFSQIDSSVAKPLVVRDILISGNKKTRDQIIRREIPFKKGDTIPLPSLNRVLSKTKENIYNTKLFLSVDIIPLESYDATADMLIIVKERWYTFPLPYIELADRSFNVWWHTYHADLRRLSYGLYFIQENLTGRNDELDIKGTLGFNKQLDVEYTTPYLNSGMTKKLRVSGGVLFSDGIPYKSSDSNKLMYFKSVSPMRSGYLSIGYLKRKRIKKREWLTLSVHGIQLFDSIKYYNPNFFSGGKTYAVYPELSYTFKYDDVDNIIYPLQGKTFEVTVSKRGLGWNGGVNRLQLDADASWYASPGRNWFSILRLGGQIKLPFDQPYFNSQALGYGENYLRGYEYYVIDGVAFFLARADLKKRLMHFEIPTFLNSRNYSTIPVTVYAKIYSDAGSVYSRYQSLLGNKFLWTGGIGLDMVTVYDMSVSINFSINNLSEKGFFFHASR